LAGGALIGVAAAILIFAGISAIVGGLLRPSKGDIAWRLSLSSAW
jgi:hypothetical protein